jgi:putative endonuclease
MDKIGWVYIVTNKRNGTLYTGASSYLVQRVYQHKHKFVDSFSKKYGLNMLVYYEEHGTIQDALYREKQIKEWKRKWKLELIEKMNPEWKDLYDDVCR